MIKLTRTELKWILRMVESDRDNSGALKDLPEQRYKALHKLEWENMSVLADKLTRVIDGDTKRIAVA